MFKKEKHCNDADAGDSQQGDNWDHVAYDPEHRLVVSVVPGKRTAKNVEKLVADFKKRTADRIMNLMTSDEYKLYRPGFFGHRPVLSQVERFVDNHAATSTATQASFRAWTGVR